MPCMCGDTACPSCGPAQGYDPKYEAAFEATFEELAKVLATNPAPSSVVVSDEQLNALTTWHLEKLVQLRDKLHRDFSEFLRKHYQQTEQEFTTPRSLGAVKSIGHRARVIRIPPILTGELALDVARKMHERWEEASQIGATHLFE